MPTPTTHYDTLGVSPGADAMAIRAAFRALAKKYHPDVNKEPEAEARFKAVSAAYEVISDETKRRTYDAELRGPPEPRRYSSASYYGADGWEQVRPFRGAGRTRKRTVTLNISELFLGKTIEDDVLGACYIPPGILDSGILFADEVGNQLNVSINIAPMPDGVQFTPARRATRSPLDHILGGFMHDGCDRGSHLRMVIRVPLPLFLLGGHAEVHIPQLDASIGTRALDIGPNLSMGAFTPHIIQVPGGGFPGTVFDVTTGGFRTLPPGDFFATIQPIALVDLPPTEHALYERHLRALATALKVDVTPPLDWKAVLREQIPLATR